MRRVAIWLIALWLAACGSLSGGTPSPASVIAATAATLGTFDEQVGQAAFAGRLTAAKASSLLDESLKIRGQLNEARALLRGCPAGQPCEAFDASLRGINDRLIEAQCRRRQAEAGLSEDVCKLPPRSPK